MKKSESAIFKDTDYFWYQEKEQMNKNINI